MKSDEVFPRVVILAGGRGRRLAPYTTILPKPLMPIGDIPILEVVIRQLGACGFKDIVLAVGYLSGLLEAYFGEGHQWDVQIQYSREDSPLGTAGPIALVPGLDRTFMLMNGDLLTTLNYRDMWDAHRRERAVATVGLFQKSVQVDLGVIETNGEGKVTEYTEKPELKYQVSMGIYFFEPRVLDYIPQGEELDLPDLIKTLVAGGERVLGYPFDGHWLDIGRHEDYNRAVEVFETDRQLFLPDGANP